MKRNILLVAVVLLSTMSTAAWASKDNQTSKNSRVIPILVNVNAEGRVTDVNPAYHVRPVFMRMLRDTLQKMITKPAMKKGKPVSSQFLIKLALTVVPGDNGKSNANFKYVSSKSLPPGSWFWVHTEDHRLALSNQHGSTMPARAVMRTAQQQQMQEQRLQNQSSQGGR